MLYAEHLQTGLQGHGGKSHCAVHVHGIGIDMGLQWEQEQAGSQHCMARTPTRGWLPLRMTVLVPVPMYSGAPQLPPAPLKSCSSYQAESLPQCFSLIQCSVAHDLWAALSDLWSVWLAEKAGSGTWLLCKQRWHIVSQEEHRKDKITQIAEILSLTVLLMWMSKIRIRVVGFCVQTVFLNSISRPSSLPSPPFVLCSAQPAMPDSVV